ncbi:MAG TPA: ABC-F family ATP-binding cassette domain-containing protein [Gemmataceae bacterium]|jgi:ATP-binding cassette subfamily F protein 3|nr:ABC-F family ATP-binding cassette domain-containing protein [Gemmataceae bacterium]
MLLLSCSRLSRAFDRGPLFDDLSFELFHGERVGFVGPNGAGKTTLMRILAGEDTPDAGDVRLHAGARTMLLEQHEEFAAGRTLFDEAKSAFGEMLKAQDEMIRVADRLAHTTDEAEQKTLSARYDRLTELLRNNDAYTLDHKVETVLNGLGFKPEDNDREVHTFSGGQRRRLLLAKLLLAAPDVMLLDEPSNHLDIDTVRWLENYLVQQSQAMLIVSHDRYFLNRVVTKIFELHERKITSYPGNYKQYVRLREERFEQRLKEYEAQREFIEKQEEYIRRVHYGQLAKQAQSRQKTLDKIERVEAPTRVEVPRMHFGKVMRSGDVVFEVDDLGKSFGEKRLFEGLSFQVQRGKRLGIMGPNGCGKTTLLRILLGDEEPTEGTVKRGHLIQVGYLDQHLKLLDETKPIIRAVWPEPDPELTEQRMRDLLGRFGLAGKIIDQPVGECSGGERSRAALARLVVEGANVLVLDEPTNHLDIWACDALEEAIKEFDGTVIVVSHDRYFLNAVSDLLIVMEPGKVEVVYGNYDLYESLRATREAEEAAERKRKAAPVMEAKPTAISGGTPKVKRKRKFPYRKVEELEKEVMEQEELVAELEARMVSPEIYRDANLVKETMADFEDAKDRLKVLYEHWEEAVELNG